MKKKSIICIYKTHKMYQIQTHTKFNGTESCIRSQAHFLVESQMDKFSVAWGVRWDAQTLVLMEEENSPYLPLHPTQWGFQIIPL